jgi:hypothetical protein
MRDARRVRRQVNRHMGIFPHMKDDALYWTVLLEDWYPAVSLHGNHFERSSTTKLRFGIHGVL